MNDNESLAFGQGVIGFWWRGHWFEGSKSVGFEEDLGDWLVAGVNALGQFPVTSAEACRAMRLEGWTVSERRMRDVLGRVATERGLERRKQGRVWVYCASEEVGFPEALTGRVVDRDEPLVRIAAISPHPPHPPKTPESPSSPYPSPTSSLPLCPSHGTPMRVSDHHPGWYCPRRVGIGYCRETAKAADAADAADAAVNVNDDVSTYRGSGYLESYVRRHGRLPWDDDEAV